MIDDPDGAIDRFVREAGIDPGSVVDCVQFASVPHVQTELAELVITHNEGEGDKSLAAWRDIHRRFFADEARAVGFAFSESSLVVLQRFEVVGR